MKTVFIICMLGLAQFCVAQSISKEDANRFEAYFFDSIAIGVNFQLTSKIYQTIHDVDRREAYVNGSSVDHSKPVYGINRSDFYREDRMDHIKKDLQRMYNLLHTVGYQTETDKQRAKRLIKRFRTEASVLPTFYQLIDKKYKGDVDRYVDYLFDNSFMGNKEVLDKLMKRPTLKKLRKDPVVLYTISKMQYLALIKLGEMEQAKETK